VLGVTLYALTGDQDGGLAILGLVYRVGEGIIAALSVPVTLTLFWLATARGADAPDIAATHALAAHLPPPPGPDRSPAHSQRHYGSYRSHLSAMARSAH
jgi:hypothetical protein